MFSANLNLFIRKVDFKNEMLYLGFENSVNYYAYSDDKNKNKKIITTSGLMDININNGSDILGLEFLYYDLKDAISDLDRSDSLGPLYDIKSTFIDKKLAFIYSFDDVSIPIVDITGIDIKQEKNLNFIDVKNLLHDEDNYVVNDILEFMDTLMLVHSKFISFYEILVFLHEIKIKSINSNKVTLIYNKGNYLLKNSKSIEIKKDRKINIDLNLIQDYLSLGFMLTGSGIDLFENLDNDNFILKFRGKDEFITDEDTAKKILNNSCVLFF